MELRHLRYFLAVARQGNFTRAAQELHLAQPPLSQQIQQLERELGVLLIDRSARQIALTPAGRELERHAEAIFAAVDDLVAATRDIAEARGGTVTLGVISTAAGVIVPAVAQRFRARLPEVELIIQEAGSSTVAELVAHRQADLGLARLPLHVDSLMDQLMSEPLIAETIILVVPRAHRFADVRAGVSIAELRDEPLMLVRRDQGTLSDLILAACAAAGFTPRLVCEGAEIDTLLRLVAAGVGITIVPERGLWLMPHLADAVVGVPLYIESGKAPLESGKATLSLTLGLLWRRQGYRSHAATVLGDIILEYARNEVSTNAPGTKGG